jgi:predicted lipid-binding transport protein (Tim44 family)
LLICIRVSPFFAFKIALPDNCPVMRSRVTFRLVTGLWVTVLAGLLLAVDSLASPGGGSSGFGGGGGGGGGFSGGGGTGPGGGSPWTVLVVFVLVALFVAFAAFKAYRLRKRRRERAARVELASAEAADDDAYFAAEAVKGEARRMHERIVKAWTDRDRDALARELGPDLLAEWVRRLDDFDRKGWHNVCEIRKPAEVEYIGLTNREDDDEDRVVVRMQALLRDVVVDRGGAVINRKDSDSETTLLAEYWTLGRTGDRWILLSIEQDAEGAHNLDAPIVASPWSDDARLSDEAVTELAVADAAPNPAELVDIDYAGDARKQALDLSVVDGRFAPAVLEAAARRAVEAWAEAVDGADDALERAATPEAAHALLYPRGTNTRLVVRGPRLEALKIAGLEGSTFTVEAELSGRRYLEDRDTAAVLEGSKDRATTFTERWTLALGDDPATPWRIVATAPVG